MALIQPDGYFKRTQRESFIARGPTSQDGSILADIELRVESRFISKLADITPTTSAVDTLGNDHIHRQEASTKDNLLQEPTKIRYRLSAREYSRSSYESVAKSFWVGC